MGHVVWDLRALVSTLLEILLDPSLSGIAEYNVKFQPFLRFYTCHYCGNKDIVLNKFQPFLRFYLRTV